MAQQARIAKVTAAPTQNATPRARIASVTAAPTLANPGPMLARIAKVTASPTTPFVPKAHIARIEADVILRTFRYLKADGTLHSAIVYRLGPDGKLHPL